MAILWTIPCVVRCGGCVNTAPSEVRFGRFAVRTPQGDAIANADMPMVPAGWAEATIRPDPTAIVRNRQIDPFETSAQAMADASQAPQPVWRCPECASKADDAAAFESAGAKVGPRSIIEAEGGFVGGKH